MAEFDVADTAGRETGLLPGFRPAVSRPRWPARARSAVPVSGSLIPFFAVLTIFFAIPTYFVLRLSFGPGLPASTILGRPGVLDVFTRTITFSLLVTALCMVLGYAYAAAIRRARHVMKVLLLGAVVIPFLTSLLVRSYAWTVVLSDQGPIADLLRLLPGVHAAPRMIFNEFAVVVGTTHVLLPIFVLPLYAVLSQLNPELERASRSLGAPQVTTFMRVTLPLSLPGVAAGAALVFIQAVGFYVTPVLLGGAGQQMASGLIAQQLSGQTLDLKAAALLSVVLLAIVAVLVLVFRACYPLERLFITPVGDVRRRRRRVLSTQPADWSWLGRIYAGLDRLPWTVISRILVGATFCYLLLPLAVVIPISFTGAGYVSFPPPSFSLRWYSALVTSPDWRNAAVNSLIAGGLGTVLALLVGVPLAFTLVRSKLPSRFKGGLMLLLTLPALMPIVVLSVGVFVFFLKWHLVGNRFALAATYSVLCLPYVTTVVVAALRDLDRRVEDAARSLGASWPRTLLHITGPILRRALFTGWLFGFLLCLDELLIAQAVTTSGEETLSIRIWQGANEQLSPALAAYSCLTFVLTLVLAVLVNGLRHRVKGSRT
jgi:putative spermidine/putrescine transport system permease protein